MPADSSSPAPAATPQPDATLVWKAALGTMGLGFVLLFIVWPYQEWDFGYRMSVLTGWLKWVVKSPDWTFCLFVPLITGGLVWMRRAGLRGLPWTGSWLGVLPLVLGLFVYWVGFKANTGYPAFLAIQLVLAGFILLLGGREWMRALFFPWLFLFFTWPVQPLEDSVASPLRYRTAAMTAKVLGMLGSPAVNEGSALQSAPDASRGIETGAAFSLDVDAKCSGINSLFVLMMISALLGYLALRSTRSRLILFICSVPLAVAGNVVRLIMLAFGSMWFGSDFAIGRRIGEHQEMSFFHTMAGFAVFGVALAGMFAICYVLEGREMKKNLARHQQRPGTGAWVRLPLPRRTLAQLVVMSVLLATILGICASTDTRYLVSKAGVTLDMPLSVGDYQGRVIGVTAEEKKGLDEGVKLERVAYLNPRGRTIISTIVLSGNLKRSLHRPEVCLPNQGWSIVESTPVSIHSPEGGSFQATSLRFFLDHLDENGRRLRQRGVNIYWYVGSDDTTSASHYEHVATTYLDAIFRNLNHRWAMVSVFVPIPPSETEGPEGMFAEFTALEDAREFAALLQPLITTSKKTASSE
ncbi:MAG: exosortase/archaeosortase family protein [Prosthecobacter sp.]